MSSPAASANIAKARGLSDGALAAIAVSSSVVLVVILLAIYLVIYRRRARKRASLLSIGAQNLYGAPKSTRDSRILVTREATISVSQLPATSSSRHASDACPSTSTDLFRSPLGGQRGSTGSTRPLLRGSYQSSTSTKAPKRPPRPSWPNSVLEFIAKPEHPIVTVLPPQYAPNSKSRHSSPKPPKCDAVQHPEPIYSPSPSPSGGQVVSTYRHPTPTLNRQGDFGTQRERAELERMLGASPGMTEVGFRREVYTMYSAEEDLTKERWKDVGRGVVLSDEARETEEWTRRCMNGEGMERAI